jgi:hypothetical protein
VISHIYSPTFGYPEIFLCLFKRAYFHDLNPSAGPPTNNNNNTPSDSGEDLMTLEAEISELQRENARVESQMLRLRSDISVMEAHLRTGDKV